ncbi:MAG TPA: hypothetical protein V6C76_12810 [Drouetiella sp.]
MPARTLECEKTGSETADKSLILNHDQPSSSAEHAEYRKVHQKYASETQALRFFPAADDLLPRPNNSPERPEKPTPTGKVEPNNGRPNYEVPNNVKEKGKGSETLIFTDIRGNSVDKNSPDKKLLTPGKTPPSELPIKYGTTNGVTPQIELPTATPGQRPFTPESVDRLGSNGVDQTTHGDCVFESTVAALAGTNQGRAMIANMITMGQNGDYIVKFPGDANPTTVTRSDILNNGAINDSAGWARILQAAMVKAHPDFAEAKVPAGAGGGTDGNPPTPAQYAAFLLTGRTAEKVDASNNDVAKYLQTALSSDNPVTAFCKDNDNGSLVNHHEWTVTAFNPNDQTVTVRNPWGHWNSKDNDGIEDLGNGQVRMPLLTFQRNFGEVTSLGFQRQQSTIEWAMEELNPYTWIKALV